MSDKVYSRACPLCDTEAKFVYRDHENRRLYLCPNNECGKFEISLTAERKLVFHSEFMKEVNEANKQKLILEIFYQDGLQASCKKDKSLT
ncbi:hypothetical protein C1E23_20710 [Pseudoalteromonas phenolica]|uniref:Uncharacterized protein n=1 Tax=Pseudoalteromonas phenolica TaxID=161398 RepID=A0A4Q7IGQ0_9GAMM|nr:hypothetical protein [Pseudoalteromonas phenolica]RZQ51213.1 hypothetical protein C1E23_20710 [Pseudoalteromonas phenolica]